MMKTLRNFVCVVVGSLSLIGCSYFDTSDALNTDGKPPAEKIDVTNKSMADGSVVTSPAPSQAQVTPLKSAGEMTAAEAKGSVEFYSLDGPTPPEGSIGSIPPKPKAATSEPSPEATSAVEAPAMGDDFDSLPPREPLKDGSKIDASADKDLPIAKASHDDAIPVAKMPIVPVDKPAPPTPSIVSHDPSVEVFPFDGPLNGAAPTDSVTNPYKLPPSTKGNISENTVGPNGAAIYFERGSTTLDQNAMETLTSLVFSRNNMGPISVVGFASSESAIKDTVTRKIANLRTSMDRAYSVTRALVKKGVPSEVITVIANGENQQADTPDHSRRVEIYGL